jgi:hypothetical protein
MRTGLERELREPGSELALPPEKLHRTRIVEVLARIGRVEDDAAAAEQLLACVHLPRKLELFGDRRPQALLIEFVVRDSDFEAGVAMMAKIRLKQAGELGVDRHEDQPRPVLTASIEMLPSGRAGQPRHQLGRPFREIVEVPGSPDPPQQGEADELAPFVGGQVEGRREVTKEIAVLGPNVGLDRRLAAKKLEPSRVHSVRDLAAAASRGLLDEPLPAIEPPPVDLRAEMAPQVMLDRR